MTKTEGEHYGTVKQLLGYDLTKTEDRATYINKLVYILLEGDENG